MGNARESDNLSRERGSRVSEHTAATVSIVAPARTLHLKCLVLLLVKLVDDVLDLLLVILHDLLLVDQVLVLGLSLLNHTHYLFVDLCRDINTAHDK